MKINETLEIIKMLVDKPPDEMTETEVRENYRDLLNVMIGIIIGSGLTVDKMKELINEKKVESNKENREKNNGVVKSP